MFWLSRPPGIANVNIKDHYSGFNRITITRKRILMFNSLGQQGEKYRQTKYKREIIKKANIFAAKTILSQDFYQLPAISVGSDFIRDDLSSSR